jgi:hypothetical protein
VRRAFEGLFFASDRDADRDPQEHTLRTAALFRG